MADQLTIARIRGASSADVVPAWVLVAMRKRRVANKKLLDLLVAHRVIEDDSLVVAITSSWDPDVAAGRVLVTVKRARARKQREAGTPAARGLDL